MTEQMLEEACATCRTPGAVLAVADGGRLEVFAAGLASVRDGERLTAAHQFPPMSITKSMTAVLVVEACRAGQLSLDTPLSEVLADLAAAPWASSVTVDQLLGCDGGVPAFCFSDTGEGEDAVLRFPSTLEGLELLSPSVSRFSYSNAAFALAAAVVETVTQARFDDLLSESVFDPLEMTGTGSWYRRAPDLPITQHLVSPDGTSMPIGWWKLRSAAGAGTGTLFTTAGDIARYGRAHIDRWLELREPRADFPGPHAESWGRGWAIYGWGTSVFGWDGFGPGAKTFLRVLPEHDAAVALLTTGSNGREVYRTVLPALLRDRYGIAMTPETWPVTPDVQATEAVIGRFRNGDSVTSIERDGPRLVLSDSFGRSLPLRPAGTHRFVAPDDFEYPAVELDRDVLTYFCSVWQRESTPSA